MLARDERAVCEVEQAAAMGRRGDGQPVKRNKPRVGHGGTGRFMGRNRKMRR
jgi:hypothetical protein